MEETDLKALEFSVYIFEKNMHDMPKNGVFTPFFSNLIQHCEKTMACINLKFETEVHY